MDGHIEFGEIKDVTASIIFETTPGPEDDSKNIVNDWALWGNPVLTSNGRTETHTKNKKTNVILITVDTLRADYLHSYGNTWIQTPCIDQMANEGIKFDNAYAPMSTTTPSHASILTSLYPYEHGVINNDYHLAERIPRLPEIFLEMGYKTGAAVSVFHLADKTSGLGKGFDAYMQNDPAWRLERGIEELSVLTRSASVTTNAAIQWLESIHNDPFFLWIHYYDPHAPYDADGDFHRMYYQGDPKNPENPSMKNALFRNEWSGTILEWGRKYTDLDYYKKEYGAEISYTDSHIQRLLDALKRLMIDENTLIVVTVDHGENHGDHGIYFDHWFLRKTDLHVPLIFFYPKKLPKGKVVDKYVSLIDIAPTILDVLGKRDNFIAKNCFEGRSLRPLWEKKKIDYPKIHHAEGLYYTEIAAWDDRFKTVWELRDREYHAKAKLKESRVFIYDLIDDPDEKSPAGCFIWGKEIERQSGINYDIQPTEIIARMKMIPNAEELKTYLLKSDEDHFIKKELLEDATFLPRIISLLEEMRKRVEPPPVIDRIKKLGDISSFDELELRSVPISDPAFMESLEHLGYTAQSSKKEVQSATADIEKATP
ncbi:MAG: sulfatase [Candidatus Omnitrophota bacterium]